jgi:predicted RNA-binding protein with PIN domain
MALILIDGYNLIGIAHDNLEKARNDLIQNLQKYSKLKKHNITLVFDGWKSGQKDETMIKAGYLTIIYSRLGEKADHVIKKILSSSTSPWIVISSDREISDFATNKDFAAVTADEFEDRLFKALHTSYENSYPDDQLIAEGFLKLDEEDAESIPSPRKGNPRKLSKKDRKKLQALKKL